jgi:hypothetical protein
VGIRATDVPVDVLPFFSRVALRDVADRHRDAFAHARPFAHAIIDDWLAPEVVASLVARFPASADHPYKRVDRDEQSARLGQLQKQGFETVDPYVRVFLSELCGQAFLDFLSRLTGIEGLIADPHFVGAGPQVTLTGGHLALHADFNADRSRSLHRRLSAIVYANADWDDAWGGHLELWPEDLSACAVRIAPLAGRLVVMAHDARAYHGHPSKLACPPDRERRAIASYYFTTARGQDDRPPQSATWVTPSG